VANSAAWIFYVAGSAWNNVNVEMRDGLTSCGSNVDSNVVAICRFQGLDFPTRNFDATEERGLLLVGCIEPVRKVAPRNQQGVTEGHWVRVPKADN
jgi:hypothetical protein